MSTLLTFILTFLGFLSAGLYYGEIDRDTVCIALTMSAFVTMFAMLFEPDDVEVETFCIDYPEGDRDE